MGRHSGYIALHTAIGSGASSVLIPEAETNLEDLKTVLRKNKARGKWTGYWPAASVTTP